ncbi:MlaA family lipoprotein [Glycocaulis sp.]|uniref:MlaA family lipoprotein n=1 Tax=Glycocaulis sp. TaxID=1969725 RepID=UPI003D1E13AE
MRAACMTGLVVLAGLALAACTTRPQSLEANDPLEPLNRAVFDFNIAADRAVIAPVTYAYRGAVPRTGRRGVRNVLRNLNEPVVLANLLLQGRPGDAFATASRFGLNTIVGVGGLFDVASEANIPRRETDFGLTLGHWGVDSGPYMVLPLLGPSSVRDTTGRFVDRYPHPAYWIEDIRETDAIWVYRGIYALDVRLQLDETFRSLERSAIDPYVQLRSVYRQNRAAALARGEDFDDLPDFD